MNPRTPRQAIRDRCLECCCDSALEVRLCPVYGCALWPWRYRNARGWMIRRGETVDAGPIEREPDHQGFDFRVDPPKRRLRAMRLRCIDCVGGETARVRTCQFTDCALWPYRLGRRPTRGEDLHNGPCVEKSATSGPCRAQLTLK